MTRFFALTLLFFAGLFFSTANASVCTDGVCAEVFESNGSAFLSLSSTNPYAKASGIVPIGGSIDIDSVQMPILIEAFSGAGFGCSGGMVPNSGNPGAPGSTTSTSLVCSIQNNNGDTWRVTIIITWRWNSATGEWMIDDIDANAKLIKASFQNQVQ